VVPIPTLPAEVMLICGVKPDVSPVPYWKSDPASRTLALFVAVKNVRK
jgi:hypothetical protein